MKLFMEMNTQAKDLIRLLFSLSALSSRLEIPGTGWDTEAGMNLIKEEPF